MKITIRECGGEHRDWTWKPTAKTIKRLNDEANRTERPLRDIFIGTAIEKFFGKGRSIWWNYELRNEGDFGQIVERLPRKFGDCVYNCVTGRVRIDVEGE